MIEPGTKWPAYRKLVFLFLFYYFLLFGIAVQFFISFLIDPLWRKVIPWFARIMGHPTPITIFSNGSGDTTFNYYQILFFLFLAILLAIVTWVLLKDVRYAILSNLLTIFLRYYIAIQMISYGLAKIYYLQFGFPTFDKLDQPLGEFSPMGLLWTFMGFSKGYTMFTGMLEFIGGLFLLNKRTTTLGALIVFGVMINVMMLNFFYDVPVKILSSHIVMMSVYLILSDRHRLLQFFVLNQNVPPQISEEVFPGRYLRAKNITKWSLIICFLVYANYQIYQVKSDYERSISGLPFFGKSKIESFWLSSKDGVAKSTDDKWLSFYQSWPGYAMVKTVNGAKLNLIFEVDTLKKQVKYKEAENGYFLIWNIMLWIREDTVCTDYF